MEEKIIGLIVFALIAIFSGLAKLQERRKEEEAREQRSANRTRVEDLPEATRRMLYGDGAPPVARRRAEGAPTPPPIAQPRPLQQQQNIPVAPQRRPVPQRQQTMPTPPPRQMPPQRPYAPEAPRPIAQPMRQERDWRQVPQRQEAPRPMPDPRRDTVSAAERERERQRAIAEAAREEAAIRNEKAPASPAPRSSQPSNARIFRNLAKNRNALRASLITMEVIGTPKGLQS